MTARDDDAPRPRERPAWAWPVLIGEVALSLALGFFALGRKSLWLDEGFSAMASSGGWSSVFGDDLDKHNMTGYHLVLSGWRVFGDGEVALRSLSVVATAAAVIAVFLVASRLFGATTGLVAGFLLAIAPFAVRYAQEVRSYALVMLLVSLASYFFVEGIERPRWWWWSLYALTAAAACYAHFFAGLVVVAHAASLVFLPRARIPLRQVVVTVVALVVLLIPLGLLVSSVDDSGTSKSPTLRSTAYVMIRVAGGETDAAGVLLALVLLGACVVPLAMLWRGLRDRGRSVETWRSAFVLAWLVVPIVIALAAAVVGRPNWRDRYFIVVLPALVIFAALGIRRISDRRVAVGFLVVVTVLAGVRIASWYGARPQEDWRSAAAYLSREARPDDGIVFCVPWVRPPFEYYELRYPAVRRPQPLSPAAPWGNAVHGEAASAAEVAEWRSAPERIWVVSAYEGFEPRGGCDLAASMHGRKRAVERDIERVLVQRYDLASS